MLTATLAAILLLTVSSCLALAGWSAPQSFGVSRYAITAVAVDARGDAAVAWATQSNPGVGPSLRAANGRLSSRTVWSSHDAETNGLSVVLGTHEVTVTWGSFNRSGTGTVRAAYRVGFENSIPGSPRGDAKPKGG
jgi:hypothetical protein